MTTQHIDLKAEQIKTLQTPRYKYSFAAKFFFFSMDIFAGKKDTLPKAKLLEILACIPYRVWELRHYMKQTRKYRNISKVEEFQKVIDWSRDAQDNEYLHLIVINQKMKEDGIKDTWYLSAFVSYFIVISYILIAKTIALFSQKKAFLFNAEFENHAEGIYAKMVENNPKWETQKVENKIVRLYSDLETWADIFRRIGLDERDHMNHSFINAGMPQYVHNYNGMI